VSIITGVTCHDDYNDSIFVITFCFSLNLRPRQFGRVSAEATCTYRYYGLPTILCACVTRTSRRQHDRLRWWGSEFKGHSAGPGRLSTDLAQQDQQSRTAGKTNEDV